MALNTTINPMAHQFSRSASSYQHCAQLQHRVRQHLLMQLPNPLHGHWLDIGCGTGMACPVLQQRGAARTLGIDLSAAMLHIAQRGQGNQDNGSEWLQADASQLPLQTENSDGIFSSLMLQWSHHLATTLTEWRRVLKPQGSLLFSTLLPGSLHELSSAHRILNRPDPINHFMAQSAIVDTLTHAGFHLHTQQAMWFVEHYDTLPQLLQTLKGIGATHVQHSPHKGLRGRRWFLPLDQSYPRDQQQRLPLSYRVLFIHAQAQPR